MLSSARPSRGFTLVELIIAVTLLAILMAMAMPSMRDWIRGIQVRGAAESLRNGVEIARMEALKRNSSVSFWMVSDPSSKVPGASCVLSSSSGGWVVSVVDPTSACNAAPDLSVSPQLVQRSGGLENPDGLTIAAVNAAGSAATQINFNGLGQVQNAADAIQTINVRSSASGDGTRALRVQVEAGGAVRMCDPAVGSSDPRACATL